MSVSFPSVGAVRMDVGRDEPKSCFVLVCLCCYNLGRFDHETLAYMMHPGGEQQPEIRFACKTCSAESVYPEQP